MVAVQGYFKNDTFINESHIPIPEGKPVIITILDTKERGETESERQRKIFAECYAALRADPEELGEEFEIILKNRPKFQDTDLL
ncbi:hypothetical protein LQZ19_10965 [Treponema primitia]|uniref:hypothetical protein n=1 Tax=Treponema primitia TaxID=88058 RepID=UPI0039802E57